MALRDEYLIGKLEHMVGSLPLTVPMALQKVALTFFEHFLVLLSTAGYDLSPKKHSL